MRTQTSRSLAPSALFTLTLALAAPAAAQPQLDFAKAEVKTQKVAGAVYVLMGLGGNIGVSVGDDGVVIVDDDFAPLAPKIEAALKGITQKPVRFVLNTHWHPDHTGGNAAFGRNAPIIAHDNVRARMREEHVGMGQKLPPSPPAALPVVTFNDHASVHLNGEEIRLIHVPSGHTDGDSVIWFTKSNVVHTGDQFVNGGFPFIDYSTGGSVRGYIANLERLVGEVKPDTKVIPGHGPVGTVADMRTALAMLKETSAIVERGIREGRTAAQLKQQKALAKYAKWNNPFLNTDSFLDLLYTDLSRAAPAR